MIQLKKAVAGMVDTISRTYQVNSVCYAGLSISLALLLAWQVLTFTFFALKTPSFYISDQHVFLTFITNGKMPFISLTSMGRFYPLWAQEYRLFLLSGASPEVIATGVFAFCAAKLMLAVTLLWIGIKKISNGIVASVACLYIYLATFMMATYWHPEGSYSTSITLWSIWFYCYVTAVQRDSAIYYIVSFLAISLSLYYLETNFIIFTPLPIIQLLFNIKHITKKEIIFHILTLLHVIIFLSIYYFLIYKNAPYLYSSARALKGSAEIFRDFLMQKPIIGIALLCAIGRILFFLRNRKVNASFADALLAGGLGVCLAYAALRLEGIHYLNLGLISLSVALSGYVWRAFKTTFIKNKYELFVETKKWRVVALYGAFTLVFIILVHNPYIKTLKTNAAVYNKMLNSQRYVNDLIDLDNKGFTLVMYIPTPEAVKEYPFQRRVARWHYVTSNIFMKFYGKNTTNEILALDNYDEIMRRIADKNEKIVFIVPPDAAAYVPLKPARDPDETVFDYKFFFSEGKYPPTGS